MWGYLDHVGYGHICGELPPWRGETQPESAWHYTLGLDPKMHTGRESEPNTGVQMPPLLQMPPTASSSCHFVFLTMAYCCLELWA